MWFCRGERRMDGSLRTTPERCGFAGNAAIEVGSHRKAIVGVRWVVLDRRVELLPHRSPVGARVSQVGGEAGGIAEGEIEAGEDHPIPGDQIAQAIGDERHRFGAGGRIPPLLGDVGAAVILAKADPDAVGARPRMRRCTPVDHHVGVEDPFGH